MSLNTQLIGLAAASISTVSFIPQVWRIYTTRDVSAISLPMYAFFSTGVALWLLYGFMQNDWPVMIANAFTLVFTLLITLMRILFYKPTRLD